MNGDFFKGVVWGNIALMVFVYFCLIAYEIYEGSYGELYIALGGGIFTFLQIVVNAISLLVLSVLFIVLPTPHPRLAQAAKGAWFSIGLLLLLSFPTCLLSGTISTHLSFFGRYLLH